MRIGPNDILRPGTAVSIGSRSGTVLSSETVRDQHGGPIELHKIQLTHRTVHCVGHSRRVPLEKPVIIQPNYSSIYVG